MMDSWAPPLRIAEGEGRIRLGLEGFGDVEGETLQEAADALVVYVLQVAVAVRAGGIGPMYTECSPDPALLDFLWRLSELAEAQGEARDLLFGPNLLTR